MRMRSVGLLVGAWCLPALLTTLQSVYYTTGSRLDAVAPALFREGLPWLVWVPVTPWIVRRASAAGALRGRALVGNIALALALGVGFGLLNGWFSHLVGAKDYEHLGYALSMGVIDWLPYQLLVFAGVFAAGLALEAAHRRRAAELARAQLENQLVRAQLSALQAQLQPHFLFNTLNAAVALARAGDAEATARVLVLLGELLRTLLRSDAPQEIPLREELALLETYLEIQRVRLGDRLKIHWNIADDVRDALVPQLVLQPLVENAVQHGIARRSRAGQLDIAAVRHGDRLRLTVCDDGPGVAATFSVEQAGGLGLRNTRERLRRLYGARSELELATVNDRTTAAIELPMRVPS